MARDTGSDPVAESELVFYSTGMKLCTRCGKRKSCREFNKSTRRKDGLQIYCRECQNAHDRELYDSSPKRRKLVRERNRAHMDAITEYTNEIKQNSGCALCGEREVVCLQFHHVRRGNKNASVAETGKLGWSLEMVKKEIKKCVVLCANCHLKLHRGKITLASSSTGRAPDSGSGG